MKRAPLPLMLVSLLGLAACESNKNPLTTVPPNLVSSPALQPGPTPGLADADFSYVAKDANMTRYTSLLLEPVTVYRGAQGHFEDLTDAQVQAYARVVNDAFEKALRASRIRATAPGEHVARLKVTLVGVSSTVGGVATVSRVLPVGTIANLMKEDGQAGTLTGGIQYAIEATDSRSGKLLAAAIRRAAPPVFDMGSTMSTDATVEAAAHEAAMRVVAKMGQVLDRGR